MKRWRCISVVLVLILGSSVYPYSMSTASADPSRQDPNSIVPREFSGDMGWSEQGSWHWVVYSYSGSNSTTSVTIQPPYFVATKVRSLSSDEPCNDCLDLGGNEQGPPLIMGGTDNALLRNAYGNLSNGPRYKIAEGGAGSLETWAAGAWYLNYNPTSDKFTSWTWIPDTQQSASSIPEIPEIEEASHALDFEEIGDFMAFLPEGSRVFPLAPGTYRLTQDFGCVAHNHGYAMSNACPSDRPSFHNGTDFGAPEGTIIYAAASGTVVFADIDPSSSSGNSVITITHDGINSAFSTEYLHWIRSYVRKGDYVYAGQPIAEVGSVGYSTGPHLHFTVRDLTTGIAIDPMIWLQSSVTPMPSTISANSALVMNVLRWEPVMRAAANKHDVPVALIAAIMTVESGGNPNAVSPAGAQGLMQIMPMHLTRYGIPSSLWRDPATNIDAGARYLAESLSNGSTINQTVARYFGIGCDVLGTCTEQYVGRVLGWYAYYTALFAGDRLPELPEYSVLASGQSAPAVSTSPSPPSGAPAPQAPTGATGPSPDPTRKPESTPQPEEPQATDPATSDEPPPEPAPTEEPAGELPPEPTPEPSPTETPVDEASQEEQSEPTESEQPAATQEPDPTPAPEPATESDDPGQASDEGTSEQETQKSQEPVEAVPEPGNEDGQTGDPAEELEQSTEPQTESAPEPEPEVPSEEAKQEAQESIDQNKDSEPAVESNEVQTGEQGTDSQEVEQAEVVEEAPAEQEEAPPAEEAAPSVEPESPESENVQNGSNASGTSDESGEQSTGESPVNPVSIPGLEQVEEVLTETGLESIIEPNGVKPEWEQGAGEADDTEAEPTEPIDPNLQETEEPQTENENEDES